MPIMPGMTGNTPQARQQVRQAAPAQTVIENNMLNNAAQETTTGIVDQTVDELAQNIVGVQNLMRQRGVPEQDVQTFTAQTIQGNVAGIPGGFAVKERDALAMRVLERVMEEQPPEVQEALYGQQAQEQGPPPMPGPAEMGAPPQDTVYRPGERGPVHMDAPFTPEFRKEVEPQPPVIGGDADYESYRIQNINAEPMRLGPGDGLPPGVPPGTPPYRRRKPPKGITPNGRAEFMVNEDKREAEYYENARKAALDARISEIATEGLDARARDILKTNQQAFSQLKAEQQKNAAEALKAVIAMADGETVLEAAERLLDAGVYSGPGAKLRAIVGAKYRDLQGDPKDGDIGSKSHFLPDDRVGLRTLELFGIAKEKALEKMGITLKGQTTDFELQEFQEIYSDPSATMQDKRSALQRLRQAMQADKEAQVAILRTYGMVPPDRVKAMDYRPTSPMPGDTAKILRGEITEFVHKGKKVRAKYLGGDHTDPKNWKRVQ